MINAGWGPHAYFKMLVDSQFETQDAYHRSLTTQAMSADTSSQTSDQAVEMENAHHKPRDSSSILDGLERGRRL